MDVTEQARRSDALYYSGNDGINRRWLCDKVASLEAALELCDSDARDHLRDFTAENAKLQDENAKLRELVRDAWGNGHPDKSCGDCEIIDECNAEIEEAHKKGNGRWNTRCLFERRIEDRMRELGIEVDE